MTRILRKLRTILLTGALVASLSPALPAQAALFEGAVDEACKGTQLDSTASADCDATAGSRVQTVLKLALNVFSFVVGFIAIIMIIIGGLKYITSGGDPNSVNGAKNTILYAAIGLVIVALAQFIVRFVIEKSS